MSIGVGLRAFTDAVGMVRARGISQFVWLPALVSLLVVASTLGLVFTYVDEGVAWVLAQLPDWLSFLEWILAPLAYLLGVLAGAWVFGYAATLIASPFLGVLSSRVETHVTGRAPISQSHWLTAIATTFAREVRKLVYYLPRALLVFLFTLLPVINLAAPFVWLAFGAWIMAVQFVDYAPENNGAAFSATLDVLKRNRAAALGFGAPTALAMAIPLLNVIAVPIAVVGGTLLWCRLQANPRG
ncbi:MAG: sulfate transporter CysZ [Gammaproteobacteria bacterium]|nr:sulfate transporter CysZ [Gammaproteobacteria bacterium]